MIACVWKKQDEHEVESIGLRQILSWKEFVDTVEIILWIGISYPC